MLRTSRALFIDWDHRWRSRLREAEDPYARRGCCAVVGITSPAATDGTVFCCGAGATADSRDSSPGAAALSSLHATCRGVSSACAVLRALHHALELASAMLLRQALLEMEQNNGTVSDHNAVVTAAQLVRMRLKCSVSSRACVAHHSLAVPFQ